MSVSTIRIMVGGLSLKIEMPLPPWIGPDAGEILPVAPVDRDIIVDKLVFEKDD